MNKNIIRSAIAKYDRREFGYFNDGPVAFFEEDLRTGQVGQYVRDKIRARITPREEWPEEGYSMVMRGEERK